MPRAIEVPEVRMIWRGPVAIFMVDATRLIDLEGAIRSGKTTACLHKVCKALIDNPGMHAFLSRFTDGDTDSKLKPPWRAVCELNGEQVKWNDAEQYDELRNGSRAYIFGLKSADQTLRYSKLRGLTVAMVYNDQTEELPYDLFLELCSRVSQPGFPQQAIFSPNPTSPNHWLAKEFPDVGQMEAGKKLVRLSLYDNAHNLSAETIAGIEKAYPPGHAKHRPMVLGLRGLNVIGEPVYKGAFVRATHERPTTYNPSLPLCEAIDFGKHHPCIVWAQFPLGGGIQILGGIVGQDLWLDDFLPVVQAYRAAWFPRVSSLETCVDPAGTHDNSQGVRNNSLEILKGIYPPGHQLYYRENSNAPDVRGAMVERLAGHMRRRTPWGEAFTVDGTRDEAGQHTRWLRLSKHGPEPWPFVADGCEAGYVWDEHFVSVNNKQVRKPKKDGWYEHGQNCVEYLELNFGGGQMTEAEEEARQRVIKNQAEAARAASMPRAADATFGWMATVLFACGLIGAFV